MCSSEYSNEIQELPNKQRLKGGRDKHKKSLFLKTPKITKEQLAGVVTPKRDSYVLKLTGETKFITGKSSSGDVISYGGFDRKGRYKGIETMSRNIQWYRQWYNWLKLALTLEESVLQGERINIDRKYYANWSIDDLPRLSFDDWWRTHRELFQSPKIKLVNATDKFNSEKIYVEIPKDRNINEVVREVKELLQGKLQGNRPRFSFKENDTTPYIKVHQQWNIFVLSQNGCSQKQIIEWLNEKYGHMIKTNVDDEFNVISTPQSLSRSLRRSRERIYRVSKGIFP